MMITRFNAECKERSEGKGKFTAKERLEIGAASMMGIPYRIAEEAFDISRTHYHNLGKKADCVLENLRASERTTERVIVLNKWKRVKKPVRPNWEAFRNLTKLMSMKA